MAERLGELNPFLTNCHAEKEKPPARTLEAYFRQPTTATLALLPLGGRHACFASSFLHIFELLLGVIEGLLLVGNLLFVLRILLVPVRLVAQTVAGVGVKRGGAHAILAIHYVEFTREQINLIFLVGDFFLPLLHGVVLVRRSVILLRLGLLDIRTLRRFVRLRLRVSGTGVRGFGLGLSDDAEMLSLGQVIVVEMLGRGGLLRFFFARFARVVAERLRAGKCDRQK